MTMHSDVFSDARAGMLGTGKSLVLSAIAQNRVILAILLAYYAAAQIISSVISIPLETAGFTAMKLALLSSAPVFVGSMIVWRFVNMVAHVRPEKPIGWLIEDMRNTFIRDRNRVVGGLVAAFSIIYFATIFSFVKESISHLNPFSWDPLFADWDRILHGGVDPYVLLAPVFGNPLMTRLADGAYTLWILLIYVLSFITCMETDKPLRRNTYLISLFLTWIIGGSVLAILLSSVGPVYYQAFGFGDRFVPLMSALKELNEIHPLTALELQDMLLESYQTNEGFMGISAMPSMHVAMSWIMAFHAFQYSRTMGWVMVSFAVLIQLSSVHLGWHYAIDGYLGLVVAAGCWHLGRWLAKLQNRSDGTAD